MYLAAATTGFFSGAGLIIAIGAQNAFVLRQSLERRHVGLVISVCALGDILFIVCGVAGIEALVRRWPGLLQLLRFGGAAFLAVYGLMAAWRAWRGQAALTQTAAGAVSRRRAVLACLAFTFLNPHVYLDTMVLLGSLSTQYGGLARWAFAAGACLASVTWFWSLGYGARLLLPVFKRPAAWRGLDALVAAFMLVLCVLMLSRPLH
ncbi:LysE/ArgO family amino acid transporter [Kerstersia gyiorum]|jgi:L-lysine exporter family protein LysE/ArgO|uniref:LysE/ArgO family amino acid transporter n=1 Tax=Kerstersia gyiorum TaxID=206506 RepID=UPI00242EAB0B|nr:LysE/ArgO family amino acid transporter [Kerstersia gyiorum]MCH4270714.1 LysE/ArgO family amino acid transporter [Kerstersia gyiorum]MCI1229542.1 LysE/ArgO family amino acid transporter [Kerstersia gyiorum]